MIREATVNDSAGIAGIDVNSSRYAYKDILSDECLYHDLTVENRVPVYERWITEKRFEIYVYEDAGTGTIQGMMEGNGIGRNFYTRNDYHPDGKEKIFKRWNQREIRYIKG